MHASFDKWCSPPTFYSPSQILNISHTILTAEHLFVGQSIFLPYPCPLLVDIKYLKTKNLQCFALGITKWSNTPLGSSPPYWLQLTWLMAYKQRLFRSKVKVSSTLATLYILIPQGDIKCINISTLSRILSLLDLTQRSGRSHVGSGVGGA